MLQGKVTTQEYLIFRAIEMFPKWCPNREAWDDLDPHEAAKLLAYVTVRCAQEMEYSLGRL